MRYTYDKVLRYSVETEIGKAIDLVVNHLSSQLSTICTFVIGARLRSIPFEFITTKYSLYGGGLP